MNKHLVSYALDFTSFVIGRLDDKEISNVRDVILFGSVSRGVADKKSDVDIFVNLISDDKGMENKISLIVDDFYKTVLFKQWKLMGIENEIRCIVGKLDSWKDIKPSIIAEGITLYSKYKGSIKGKNYVIFYWDKIKPESKRVLLSKRLYGYFQNKKRYAGLMKKTSALKLGSNCIFVPLESVSSFKMVFEDLGISARMIYVQKTD